MTTENQQFAERVRALEVKFDGIEKDIKSVVISIGSVNKSVSDLVHFQQDIVKIFKWFGGLVGAPLLTSVFYLTWQILVYWDQIKAAIDTVGKVP